MRSQLRKEIKRLKGELEIATTPMKKLDLYGMIKVLETMLEDLD